MLRSRVEYQAHHTWACNLSLTVRVLQASPLESVWVSFVPPLFEAKSPTELTTPSP